MALAVVLTYVLIALLDSIHYFPLQDIAGKQVLAVRPVSVLDTLLAKRSQFDEKTYSAPFALTLFSKETKVNADGSIIRVAPRLHYITSKTPTARAQDLIRRGLSGLAIGAILSLFFWCVCAGLRLLIMRKDTLGSACRYPLGKQSGGRAFLWTTIVMLVFVSVLVSLAMGYHVLGTGKVGQDILYEAIKSIRTGILIGTLTTLVMLPFAVLLGTAAGYYQGFIDDLIQYLYTTISSIPGVLLIAATILVLQITIANHPELFPTMSARADARLLALCIILGLTSWTGLCRVIRAETLKFRELDYIAAAKTQGVSSFKIILRHIIPNVGHIILISVVLDFSSLVLAEAVLSYVGVGVDPTMSSWGNMINGARLEIAREPMVWWPLLAAFVFMFILVLAVNLFADALRDAFDPRAYN